MSDAETSVSRRVGAVIVNFNAGDELTRCVDSLQAEDVHHIIVCDNGSSDDSLQTLKNAFSDIPVEHLPNPGYGAAMNHGARLLDTEVLFILNPDVVIRPGCVSALLQRLDASPELAMVGPRIENPDGSIYPSARRFPSFVDGIGHALFGMFNQTNRWTRRYKMLDWGHGSYRQVDWISGSAMFTRRRAFDDVGGFDEAYWLYMEEVDLCWRLHQHGWRIAFEPAAVVVHMVGLSTGKSPEAFRIIRSHHESVVRYHRKTARGVERVLLPFVVAGMAVRLPIAYIRTKRAQRAPRE
jgi:N-acetylglucosaminyl-diphospho-decaprenol L-rhamnosyltransferase